MKIEVQDTIVLDFEKMTKEIDQIIGEEVHNLFNDLKQKGEDVHDTRHFKNSIMSPRKTSYGWVIHMKAKYSSILWEGRRQIGNKFYGSVNWFNGGAPMLQKTANDITREVDNVRR